MYDCDVYILPLLQYQIKMKSLLLIFSDYYKNFTAEMIRMVSKTQTHIVQNLDTECV